MSVGVQSYVHITNTIFTNSSSTVGGALYGRASYLYFHNCTISNCIASTNGGAIFSEWYSRVDLVHSSVFGNQAGNSGGAILMASSGLIKVVNSTFRFNQVDGYGGALYMTTEATSNLTHALFSNNTANRGGAIFTQYRATNVIILSEIIHNTAMLSGGGIYCSDSKLKLYGAIISNNTVEDKSESQLDIYCSSNPPYTQCSVTGDGKTGMCDAIFEDGSNQTIPTYAIIGFALAGAAIVICFILVVACMAWKRRVKQQEQVRT